MGNSVALAFRGARVAQKKIQEVNPNTDEYAHWIEIFTMTQESARREHSYKGCIHGPKKGCPIDAVALCDCCIREEEEK
ncbi:hypothetical protein CMI37_22570 [Candidatus Pacearchaeota archaeon]|jgi:hypothetical protein|nr:hypothetical protein [Candidatus Pacearchaeota archaeon]|tara:strand:- start:2245 stop:2481 length:237 start_codon:yes stop_codon:yes gene_type:complete